MKIVVRIESGTLAGREYELETGFLTIGRSETCSIRFDPNIERIASKQHAFVESRSDGFYIRDNQSTNGTYLNGARVESARLNSGDRVQFGRDGVTAVVQIEETGASQENVKQLEARAFQQAAASQPSNLQLLPSMISFAKSLQLKQVNAVKLVSMTA